MLGATFSSGILLDWRSVWCFEQELEFEDEDAQEFMFNLDLRQNSMT